MRKGFALLAFFLCLASALTARATTVFGNLYDLQLENLNTKILFTPTNLVLVTGRGLSVGPPKTIVAPGGAFSTELDPGDYSVSFPSIPTRAAFPIAVFQTNQPVNITNLMNPGHTYVYTGPLPPFSIAASNNITISTNGNTYYISSTGGSNGITNHDSRTINFDGTIIANAAEVDSVLNLNGNTFGPSWSAVGGTLTASAFSGSGSSLTSLNGSQVTSGTVGDARLSSNVPLANANNVFTGSNTMAGLVKRMSPAAGNDANADMQNATEDHVGQLGVSWYSGPIGTFLWNGIGAAGSKGTNAWTGTFVIPNGVEQMGQIGMAPNEPNSLKIIANGNPADATIANAALKNSSYVFHYNYNAFSDGNFFCTPLVTTNVHGSPVLTNTDGVKIYEEDQWGLEMGTIPETFIVGETNQAGSFQLIAGGGSSKPLCLSFNGRIGSEASDSPTYFSQHSWIIMEQGTPKHHVLFPHHLAHVWMPTNANWKNSMDIDEDAGTVTVSSNLFVGGALMATSQVAGVVHYIGTAWFNPPDAPTVGLAIGTNAAWAPKDNAAFTFDDATDFRLGFAKKNGQFPKLAHASGAPFTIARSSNTSLQSAMTGQTLTDELTVDSSGNTTVSGLFIVHSNSLANLATAIAGMVNGDVTHWSSNGYMEYAINKDASGTLHTNALW